MAKLIKYYLATEHPYEVVVEVPTLNENGDTVFVKEVQHEVTLTFSDVTIKCYTEASLQANLTIAEREAYDGVYTVEDDGEPMLETQATTDDLVDALLGVTE